MSKVRKHNLTVGQEVLHREKRVNEATGYILGTRTMKDGKSMEEPAQKAAHILNGIIRSQSNN